METCRHFASNDDTGRPLRGAHGKGLDVPDDLTVAAFSDAPLATTV